MYKRRGGASYGTNPSESLTDGDDSSISISINFSDDWSSSHPTPLRYHSSNCSAAVNATAAAVGSSASATASAVIPPAMNTPSFQMNFAIGTVPIASVTSGNYSGNAAFLNAPCLVNASSLPTPSMPQNSTIHKTASFPRMLRRVRRWVQERATLKPSPSLSLSKNTSGSFGSVGGSFKKSSARRTRRIASVTFLLLLLIAGTALCLWVLLPTERLVLPPWGDALAVLVQHDDAPQRMGLSSARKMTITELPSWTLHIVSDTCTTCADYSTYAPAVQRAARGIARATRQQDAKLQGEDGEAEEGVYDFRNTGADAAATPNVDGEEDPRQLQEAHETLQRRGPHAVFATLAAPMGRIGPMLLAMRSVTDDVDAATELPSWSWMRHTINHHHGAAASTTPYVAVMGIPTVDSASHEQLRESQRATWLRYNTVASDANNFNGRLLPLYIFSAKEPYDVESSLDPSRVPQDEDTGLTVDAHAFLPTMREFSDASKFYHAREVRSATEGENGVNMLRYAQRRIALRGDWQSYDVWSSPCSHVVSSTVYDRPGFPIPSMVSLSEFFDLPVTPVFTAGAQYLCVASSALWQEALRHKNMLWIDMLTDRLPSTAKKTGEDGGWGLPVEVGMTQKTVLWLEYAYHAFPDVPYIIKGDDDTYVKVPQLVSDMLYIRGGRKTREPDAHTDAAPAMTAAPLAAQAGADGENANNALEQEKQRTAATGAAAAALVGANEADASSPDCVYWGLLWGQDDHLPYFVGMLYLLDRRLARVVLERSASPAATAARATAHTPTKASTAVDLVRLAMLDYHPSLDRYYRANWMHEEDRFIGATLKARRDQANAVCPGQRVTYVEEGSPRFHDLRRGYRSVVTWASVVIHRCTPADMRYLDYYFHNEHKYGSAVVAVGAAADPEVTAGDGNMDPAVGAAAAAAVAGGKGHMTTQDAEADKTEQAAQQRGTAWARSHLDSSILGWDQLQPVQWVPHGSMEKNRKKRIVTHEDGVAVYDVTFRAWQFERLVAGGLMSVPHYKKESRKYVTLE